MPQQGTTTSRRRQLFGAGLAVAVALVAGCGGDDDDDSASTPSAPSATDSAAPTTTEAPARTPESTVGTTASSAPTTEAAATEPTDPPTTEPATGTVSITSEDGNLTLIVGAADAARVDPSVRILDPSEWPAELGDADQLPGVTIYEMEPDGADFDEPVVVTRRIEMTAFGDAVDAGSVPVLVPFTQEADGSFVPLDDLAVTRIGDDLLVSGTTTHFSPLGTMDVQLSVRVLDVEQFEISTIDDIDEMLERLPPAQIDTVNDRHPTARLRNLPSVPEGFTMGGAPPIVTSRSTVSPDRLPVFTPVESVIVGEVPQSGLQVPLIRSLITNTTDVPPSPLFDGVDVPEQLAVAVQLYVLEIDRQVPNDADALREAAETLAAAAGLKFEIIHSAFGSFPSFSRVEVFGTEELSGVDLFAVNYGGEFGPDAQITDLVPMSWEGDAYTADVGLTSYGDVEHAVFISLEDSIPPGEMTPIEQYDSFMSLPGAVMALFVPDPFTVTADEGVIFDGPADYEISDVP